VKSKRSSELNFSPLSSKLPKIIEFSSCNMLAQIADSLQTEQSRQKLEQKPALIAVDRSRSVSNAGRTEDRFCGLR